MATTSTPHLSLVKPTPGTHEPAQISIINSNMDILDNAVTLTGSQTLTNKILTSPHFTTAVVDSGGLVITAGNLQVTVGVASIGVAVNANDGLLVQGPGNSSSTYAAVFQNSTPTTLMSIRDDGNITICPAAGSLGFF